MKIRIEQKAVRSLSKTNLLIVERLAEELPIIKDLFMEQCTVPVKWNRDHEQLALIYKRHEATRINRGNIPIPMFCRWAHQYVEQIWIAHHPYITEHLVSLMEVKPEYFASSIPDANTLIEMFYTVLAVHAYQTDHLKTPYTLKEVDKIFEKIPTQKALNDIYFNLFKSNKANILELLREYPLFYWLVQSRA